jgi:hypothetical protein
MMSPSTYSQFFSITWTNLTRQAGRNVRVELGGTTYIFGDVSTTIQTGYFEPSGANAVVSYYAYTFLNSTGGVSSNSPTNTVTYLPYAPSFEAPSWNSLGTGLSQAGTVYSGGGQTRISYNAMNGSPTYNILKNNVLYLSNVSMPYTLTHTGANGTLAQYVAQAVGIGGTSSGTWQIQPYNVTSGAYVVAAGPPTSGNDYGYMDFVNNNIPGSGLYYQAIVGARLYGDNCSSCGCQIYLSYASGIGQTTATSVSVLVSGGWQAGNSSSWATFFDTYYQFKDAYGNGPLTSPTYYGSFGNYNLADNC